MKDSLLSQLRSILVSWLRSLALRPLELRISWALVIAGAGLLGSSAIGSVLQALGDWLEMPILLRAAIILGGADIFRTGLGVLLCGLGFYILYITALSPRVRRTKSQLHLAKLLESGAASNLAITTAFENAFSFPAPADAIKLLMSTSDPIRRAMDYKWARPLISSSSVAFVAKPGYEAPLQNARKWSAFYFFMSFTALGVFAFGLEPWTTASPRTVFVLLGFCLALSCIPVLRNIRRLHALSRLV